MASWLVKTTHMKSLIPHTPKLLDRSKWITISNFEREHNDAYLVKKSDDSYVLNIVDHVQGPDEWEFQTCSGIFNE